MALADQADLHRGKVRDAETMPSASGSRRTLADGAANGRPGATRATTRHRSRPVPTRFGTALAASSFVLVTSPVVVGLSIFNVTGGASGTRTATLVLATGVGYDYGTAATLAVRARTAAHSGSADITSTTLPLHPFTEQAR